MLAVAVALCQLACGGAPPVDLPDVLIASGWLTRLASPSGEVKARRFLPSPASDLTLSRDGRWIGVALQSGAAVFEADDLAPVWTEHLGDIVDALVFHPAAPRLYLLVHPGSDAHAVADNHVVLEIELPDGTHGRRFELDRRSFDLAIDPAGRTLMVTDLIGRDIHRIDLEGGGGETLTVATGAPRAQEPEQAMLRVAIATSQGDWVLAEDDRSTIRLWSVGDGPPAPLPFVTAVAPPVLGGAAFGDRLWLHTRQHLIRVDNGRATAELRLVRRDDEGPYRYADFAADGSLAVLVAPFARQPQGPPRALVQFWDLDSGRPLSRRMIETFAGPVVLLTGGATD